MRNIIIIETEDITGLVPESNFIIKDTITGKVYSGNDTEIPDEVLTTNTPVFYSRIYLNE